MECNECQRLVHYKCTSLPTYQLQQFLTKGYRNFVCVNCVEVPEYLLQIAPSEQRPASCLAKIITELTEQLQKQSKENNCQKADVLEMTSKQQLCGGNQRYEEELQKKTIEITELQAKIATCEGNEVDLKNLITTQENNLRDQE